MKREFLSIAFVMISAVVATADGPIYDSFEAYQPTPFLFETPDYVGHAAAGTGFADKWSVSNAVTPYVNGVDAAMGYTGNDFAIVGGNVAMELGPGPDAATRVFTATYITPQSAADIWFSFLLETDETTAPAGASDRDFFQVMFTTQEEGATDNTLSVVLDNQGFADHQFQARAGGATAHGTGTSVAAGVANVPGQSSLIVGCLRPNGEGAYDTIDLYVNPTSTTLPATPDASATYAIAAPLTSIDKIYTRASVWEEDDALRMDELRVGKTYTDVLALYENAIRADDPAVYLRFDGTESDLSGLEAYSVVNNFGMGTGPSGEPQPNMDVSGPLGGAFESNNSAVSFAGEATRLKGYDVEGEPSVLDFASGDSGTFEAWVKVETMPDGEQSYIISKGRNEDATLQNYGVRLKRAADDAATLNFIYRNETDTDWNIWNSTATLAVGDDEWHHIALSYTFGEGTSLEGYIDGERVSGTWVRGAGNDAPYVGDETLWIGSAQTGLETSTLDGSIDEVAIYRDILSADTIAAHYALASDDVGEPSIAGDLDGDGFVGSSDLDIVRANWGQTVTAGDVAAGDPSGDGSVGSADLDVVRANWGAQAAAAVPEPSTVVLCLMALAAFVTRRRME